MRRDFGLEIPVLEDEDTPESYFEKFEPIQGALLNDLAQRLNMRGAFKDPRDLDCHLAIVEEKKGLLAQYAALINKTIQPSARTVFEILWARDRCGQDVAIHRERLVQVVLPVVIRYTRTKFTQAEQFLSVYAQHLTAVLSPCESLDQHLDSEAVRV
jgi:hypothetical protein